MTQSAASEKNVSLDDPKVRRVLDRLHEQANQRWSLTRHEPAREVLMNGSTEWDRAAPPMEWVNPHEKSVGKPEVIVCRHLKIPAGTIRYVGSGTDKSGKNTRCGRKQAPTEARWLV